MVVAEIDSVFDAQAAIVFQLCYVDGDDLASLRKPISM
jgi:hypothetical protein